jgi:hypothetical protein
MASVIAGRHDEAAADARPCWEAVEALLHRLAAGRVDFATATAPSNWISVYDAERRIQIVSGTDSNWISIDAIRECRETFERLGRIRRRDVLEPGRRSAFMMALFAQVRGVHEEIDGEPYLVIAPA